MLMKEHVAVFLHTNTSTVKRLIVSKENERQKLLKQQRQSDNLYKNDSDELAAKIDSKHDTSGTIS